jgi:acyl-CoA dehydrogenase
MLETIGFFEHKGKRKLKADDHNRVWYSDWLDFQKGHGLFATLLTPAAYGGPDARWDTWRNGEFSEILAFYGLAYWYTWQVSVLGLGPIWMSHNEQVKCRAAELLREGAVFAFGLSEKEHGADIYATEMAVTPTGDGTYKANGEKYYIGNGNIAPMVSTFGKLVDRGDYVFFVADYRNPQYACLGNLTVSQSYVANFALHDYPLTEAEILSKGQEAWDAALNTVNIGKYNLGWASIGICTHAFYEAITHASHRCLYGMTVTDFPHVKRMLTDAYARLVAMKLFALRAGDYMRSASLDDRRYLLYNPTVKMQVTTQGEEVINLLWDVIAAKGFEKDTYFEMATRDIRALPKLEGTVHVNIALILKFIANYFFNPSDYARVPRRNDAADDTFLFRQGPAKGLGRIRFHDYRLAYNLYDTPNLQIFEEQIAIFKQFLAEAMPNRAQTQDTDFLMALGEMFTLVVYGQLILESAKIDNIDADIIDQIFDFMVRDFSKFALAIHDKPSSSPEQTEYALRMIKKPSGDSARYDRVWNYYVHALSDQYEMTP